MSVVITEPRNYLYSETFKSNKTANKLLYDERKFHYRPKQFLGDYRVQKIQISLYIVVMVIIKGCRKIMSQCGFFLNLIKGSET